MEKQSRILHQDTVDVTDKKSNNSNKTSPEAPTHHSLSPKISLLLLLQLLHQQQAATVVHRLWPGSVRFSSVWFLVRMHRHLLSHRRSSDCDSALLRLVCLGQTPVVTSEITPRRERERERLEGAGLSEQKGRGLKTGGGGARCSLSC